MLEKIAIILYNKSQVNISVYLEAGKMEIAKDIKYIGVNDRKIDLFEGQYIVPEGMAYNSYVIIDEKTAVFDTVDASFTDEWLGNLEKALEGTTPDYLIVQHMEPDHSSGIMKFLDKYPEAAVVGNTKTFNMAENFFGDAFNDKKRLIVKDGDALSLGKHNLKFIFAPMVHWPEVMLTYDDYSKVLFSADAFGKFGALDCDEEWDCEARRYYFGIVGKYGMQVQNLLKKAAELEISAICPLHGPVIKDSISHCIELYKTWSSYGVESEGVVIAYTSVYGHTKEAVELLKEKLIQKGCKKVSVHDLARMDMAEAVEDSFRYGKLVLATTTYNSDIFPFMRTFTETLAEHNYQSRTIGIIENGTWAPTAAKVIKDALSSCKNISWANETVTIKSALNSESIASVERLADELCK